MILSLDPVSSRRRSYLGAVGVEVNGWDGGGEGVHFSLVGGNFVLQSTKGLKNNLCKVS